MVHSSKYYLKVFKIIFSVANIELDWNSDYNEADFKKQQSPQELSQISFAIMDESKWCTTNITNIAEIETIQAFKMIGFV